MKWKLPRSLYLSLLVIALLAGIGAGACYAQVLYGSIVGTVTDQTGAVVPGAQIALTGKETGLTREATSDSAGRYSIVNILPGVYNVKFTAQGFKPLEQTNIQVTINTVSRVDVQLTVGAVAEQVTVEATAVQLQTDKSDVRVELTSKPLTTLPLNTYRNYQALMVMVPGTTPVALQNDINDTPGRSLSFNVNGVARNINTTRVDGATNVFIWLPHHTLYTPSVDAIETVNISTTSFDAEQGMAGGAAITVTTKAGTNDIHGTVNWLHNNQHFNARPRYFLPNKPLSIVNFANATIGGPVVKNKLFYFFSFEKGVERIGVTGRYSVPPADVRTGDFSKYEAYSKIYDPLSGDAKGNNRTQFPGNKIPDNRITQQFKDIQKMAPLPNDPGQDAWGLSGNFVKSGMRRFDRNQYDVKVNYVPTSKLTVWGKYSRQDALVDGSFPFGELTGPGLGTGGKGDTNVNIPTGGFTYQITPTFIMDGVFGYTRFDQTVLGPGSDKNWGLDVWKIPGTNGGALYKDDSRYKGQPALYTGFTVWGYEPTWFPLFRNDRTYTYTHNFSKQRGAHELRWGFDMVKHSLNHWQPEVNHPRGSITFSGNATMINGGTARSINQYAGALLGLIGDYGKSVQFFDMKTREWQYAWYLRDRWQATRNLTLNFGLRVESYPLINRGDRGIERWDPATNIVYFGGLGSTPRNAGITVSKVLFSPRLGFAYRLGTKTVVRAGYGITQDPLPFGRPLRGLYPASISQSDRAIETYGWYGPLDKGIPEVAVPDVSKGQVVLPSNVDMGPRSPWGGHLSRGYIESWNLTIERELPWNMVGSIGYVGNHTVNQLLDRDINASTTLGGGNASRPLYASQGRSGGMAMWDGWGSAHYNGLQVQVNRSYRNMFLKGAYTWAKAMNMADDTGWQGVTFNHPQMLDRNYALAGYDRTHGFVQSFAYDLPIGKGQAVNLDSRLADLVFGGWQVNGLVSMYTGTPIQVSASNSALQMPGTPALADIVGTPKKIGAVGPGTQFYDVSAFADPNWANVDARAKDKNAPWVYRLGSSGRNNALRGPGFIRPDIGFAKTFKITERVNMTFKAESFNFTNTPRFNNPGAGVASMVRTAGTGQITNVNNFMAITNDYDGGSSGTGTLREWRFALRLAF